MIKLFLGTVAVIAAVVIGASNLQPVEFDTVVAEDVHTSVAFLLFAAFGSGFVIASMMGLHHSFQTRRQHREQFKQIMDRTSVLLPAPPEVPRRQRPRAKRRFLPRWR